MSKVATVWQFSLSCIMSKKCLLMKRAHFVGIICCWQWQYLNWQTGPLPKAMLLFFSSFFIFKLLFKRHEGNISSFNCFIYFFFFCFVLFCFFFNCDLMARVWNTHFNDFIIFSFRERDSFPEEIS